MEDTLVSSAPNDLPSRAPSKNSRNMTSPLRVSGDDSENKSVEKTQESYPTLQIPPYRDPTEKLTGGKRGPSAPLVTTSDEDEPVVTDEQEPTSSVDYENVSSPGNSSTASGPVYVRQPGFQHHAHEISVRRTKIKKKKSAILPSKDGLKKRDPTPPKSKPKREPLPMRLRALPQSFWQQPNVPHNGAPGAAFPMLPPLYARETDVDVTDVRPITPPDGDKTDKQEKEKKEKKPQINHRQTERKINIANPDLLFKLFDGIDEDKNPTSKFKRGRPRKVVPSSNKSLLCGEDPYLVDGVSEKLFPQLSLQRNKQSHSHAFGGGTSLQLIRLREGDKSVMLPSLSIEQNYSQMLSELVMHI